MGATLIFAGIVAKGLGIIAVIFGLGVLVGVVITSMVVARFRRRRS